jgi:TusE/DsrC/DsvC family sulfur relay protein
MQTIEFDGIIFEIDKDGYLLNFDQWCDQWLELMKKDNQIDKVTDDHWKVLNVIREYYKKNNAPPTMSVIAQKQVLNLFIFMSYFLQDQHQELVKWQVCPISLIVYRSKLIDCLFSPNTPGAN